MSISQFFGSIVEWSSTEELSVQTYIYHFLWRHLGDIQQLRWPNFTQFWPPPHPLKWTIVDILHEAYPLSVWFNMDFTLTPHPTFLIHVVIEWPLFKTKWIVVMSAIMHKLLSVNINKFWSDRYQFRIWQQQFRYGCAQFFWIFLLKVGSF